MLCYDALYCNWLCCAVQAHSRRQRTVGKRRTGALLQRDIPGSGAPPTPKYGPLPLPMEGKPPFCQAGGGLSGVPQTHPGATLCRRAGWLPELAQQGYTIPTTGAEYLNITAGFALCHPRCTQDSKGFLQVSIRLAVSLVQHPLNVHALAGDSRLGALHAGGRPRSRPNCQRGPMGVREGRSTEAWSALLGLLGLLGGLAIRLQECMRHV